MYPDHFSPATTPDTTPDFAPAGFPDELPGYDQWLADNGRNDHPTDDELEFMRLDSVLSEIEHGGGYVVANPLAFEMSSAFARIEDSLMSMLLRGWRRHREVTSDRCVFVLNGHFADVACTEASGVRVELRRSLLGAGTLHHLSLARKHKHWDWESRGRLAELLRGERTAAKVRREMQGHGYTLEEHPQVRFWMGAGWAWVRDGDDVIGWYRSEAEALKSLPDQIAAM